MKTLPLFLSISLIIVAFVLGMAGGYYVSPSYQQTMYTDETMDLGAADRFVDLRYLNAMSSHHRGAILLANQIAGKSSRPEINQLAQDIQNNEPKLIEQLSKWKKDWYGDNRSASKPVVANLGAADKLVDLRFLNALIAHHEEGIKMTREIRAKTYRTEILNDADAVENFLSGSLVTLKDWRQTWFNVN